MSICCSTSSWMVCSNVPGSSCSCSETGIITIWSYLYGLYLSMRHSVSIVYDTFSTVSTVCVTGAGAGVDIVWEQRKFEASKMLENRAESPASNARFVGLPFDLRATKRIEKPAWLACILMNFILKTDVMSLFTICLAVKIY